MCFVGSLNFLNKKVIPVGGKFILSLEVYIYSEIKCEVALCNRAGPPVQNKGYFLVAIWSSQLHVAGSSTTQVSYQDLDFQMVSNLYSIQGTSVYTEIACMS